MKRRHLFELEDLPWWPAAWRDYMTDYLRFVVERLGFLGFAAQVLEHLLAESGEHRVVDVGSGGGGTWKTLAGVLKNKVPGLRVTLTDLYPNHAALARVVAHEPEVLGFEADPVDALDLPGHLTGVRTHFLSFHHFRPEEAGRLLRNAVDAGAPVAVFEAQRRSVGNLLLFVPLPLLVALVTPWLRPFRWGRLLFTYLVPVVPFAVLWDGLVSALRTYRPDEMLALAAAADPDGVYRWRSAELRHRGFRVPYLTGTPRAHRARNSQ